MNKAMKTLSKLMLSLMLTFTATSALAEDAADIAINMPADLSVLGMFGNADIIVKLVMFGLFLASIATWSLLFAKGRELKQAKARLQKEHQALDNVASLKEAAEIAKGFDSESVTSALLNSAINEVVLSEKGQNNEGIKERTGLRLERQVSASIRFIARGNGVLATVGAISPFVGLFGTVWGIMNSFIGIAHSQTTNLAVVAPGIAEALLATALGLVAAIPAVVIYNIFSRLIAGYRGQVGDMAAAVMVLQGRDLDIAANAKK